MYGHLDWDSNFNSLKENTAVQYQERDIALVRITSSFEPIHKSGIAEPTSASWG